MTEFLNALPITMVPLLQTFVLGFVGAGLVKGRVLDRAAVDLLTRLIMQLFLPLMIFTTIVGKLRPGEAEYAGWYLMPLVAAASIAAVMLLTWLPTNWLCPPERRRPFHLLASFQNAGYLPIVIVEALFSADPALEPMRDRMLVLLFLYIMGQNPLLWFVGVIISRQTKAEGNGAALGLRALIQQGISPPLVASLSAVTICLLGVPQQFSDEALGKVLQPLELLGSCTVPLVMLVLGAMIALLDFRNRPPKREVLSLIGLRLLLLPLVWMGLLEFLLRHGWAPMAWAVILFVESMTPSATNVAVMVRRYGSDEAAEFVSHALFPIYLTSLVTMPFWLTLWRLRNGFGP